MSCSMTSYVTFMTSQSLRKRDVTTEPENLENISAILHVCKATAQLGHTTDSF